MTWHREPNVIGRTDYISGPYRISPREPESDPASVGYGITQWDVSYDGEPIALENSLAAAKDYADDDREARIGNLLQSADQESAREEIRALRRSRPYLDAHGEEGMRHAPRRRPDADDEDEIARANEAEWDRMADQCGNDGFDPIGDAKDAANNDYLDRLEGRSS